MLAFHLHSVDKNHKCQKEKVKCKIILYGRAMKVDKQINSSILSLFLKKKNYWAKYIWSITKLLLKYLISFLLHLNN